MVAVRVVQVPLDKIIDVVAVWHRVVAAARTMYVALFVTCAAMRWRTIRWVRGADSNYMLFNLVAGRMVQAAVVEIVDMVFVNDARMTAVRAVFVFVPFVMFCHGRTPLCCANNAAKCSVRTHLF